jgi:hypothetical protein
MLATMTLLINWRRRARPRNNNPTDPVPSARFQVPRPGLNYERELRNRRRLIITEQQNGRRRREGKGGRQKTIEKMEESRISIDQMF